MRQGRNCDYDKWDISAVIWNTECTEICVNINKRSGNGRGNQEKLSTLGPQETRRRKTKQNTTQYVLDTTIRKQTEIM